MCAEAGRQPVPPHSVEAEQSVLGALMLDSSAWARVSSLSASDFYRPDHRVIAAAIFELCRQGKPADPVTVNDRLRRQGPSGDVGGLAYLAEITRDTPSAANVEHYAAVVRERSALRRLATVGTSLVRAAQDPGGLSAAQVIAGAQAELVMLQTTARAGRGLMAAKALATEFIDDLDARQGGRRGLPVGLADFDGLTGGLESGDLVVIAARPGMGKTALLVSVAAHVSAVVPVAVFSAEMPAQQLMRRAVALRGSVTQGKLRGREVLSPADWDAIVPAALALGGQRLWIDDTPLPALHHIRAETMGLKAQHGLGLVMVDYVQLVSGEGANRYEELRQVAYGLKALAKDLRVPVIVLAQFNRGVEQRSGAERRPRLSDLRDSGAIEEAADIVGLLYSESYYNPQFEMPYVLECNIEKHRNGERGQCLWLFDGAYSRVADLEVGPRAQYRRLMAEQHQQGQRGTHDKF